MPAPVERLAALIQEMARARAAASPPPRALPYLGLEPASGTGFHLLDALSTRGIFRKYEHVLDLGAGLGGRSRWLAMRLGCEVVGTTAAAAEASAGLELTRRAGLRAHVRLVPAAAHALPFRTGGFTHVWIIEALPRVSDPARALAEAFRVVRPGGTLALQDLVTDLVADHVAADGNAPPALAGWRPAPLAERLADIRRAGFVDLEVRDRTAEAAERSVQIQAARTELLRRLRGDAALARIAEERDALGVALDGGRLHVVQVLGRRP